MSSAPIKLAKSSDKSPKKAKPKAKPAAKKYKASIVCSGGVLSADSGKALAKLENGLGMPLWLLMQGAENVAPPYRDISELVHRGFYAQRDKIKAGKPVALLIDSPGGNAHAAYKIARLFQRRASKFVVIVPDYAKSASTLLALGGELIMGRDAQLGPLDVQMADFDREEWQSALDAVQALERLHSFSMVAVDQLMNLLAARTKKKVDVLLPMVLKYSTDFVRPMLDKIDTVDYTKKSRELKVAEEYATRLMRDRLGEDRAITVASDLVERYPTHGFVIDREEAKRMGIELMAASLEVVEAIEAIGDLQPTATAIGALEELTP